jgi:type II secretory pathway component PulF
MESGKLKFAVLGALFGLALAGTALGTTVYHAGWGLAVPGCMFLMMLYGWLFYVFVRYRHARQDELLNVLAASVEAKLPLAPALQAYLEDRPKSPLYHFLIAAILNIFVAPYFWIWHELHRFDRRVGYLVDELKSGESLSQALRAVPSVASQETRIAASVGEATGNLAACLRRTDRERTTAAWLELLPRLLYPAFLLFFIGCTLAFFFVNSMPRYKRIFEDFKLPLPTMTMYLIAGWQFVSDHMLFIAPAILVGIALVIGILVSPEFRWHVPIVGRLYRWDLQSLVFRSLGSLLEMGRPVPEALGILQSVDDLPAVVKRQLVTARRFATNGATLATSLRRAGLMPRSMVPLVQTAERTRTLPWTLNELGELRSGKALRLVRRISILIAPLLVIGVGVLVGVVVTGIFQPLVNMIDGLSR